MESGVVQMGVCTSGECGSADGSVYKWRVQMGVCTSRGWGSADGIVYKWGVGSADGSVYKWGVQMGVSTSGEWGSADGSVYKWRVGECRWECVQVESGGVQIGPSSRHEHDWLTTPGETQANALDKQPLNPVLLWGSVICLAPV